MGDEAGQDERLLRRVADGDEHAFVLLYRRHLPLVLRWSLVQTGDRELAADLAAEVFAAALLSARRYRPERGPAAAWLLGIARNKLLESLRRGRVESRARRRLRLEPVALTDGDLERVDQLTGDDHVSTLAAALPADLREALQRRVIDEWSYARMAGELRCSQAVARQRVSRALRTLRSQLEE